MLRAPLKCSTALLTEHVRFVEFCFCAAHLLLPLHAAANVTCQGSFYAMSRVYNVSIQTRDSVIHVPETGPSSYYTQYYWTESLPIRPEDWYEGTINFAVTARYQAQPNSTRVFNASSWGHVDLPVNPTVDFQMVPSLQPPGVWLVYLSELNSSVQVS